MKCKTIFIVCFLFILSNLSVSAEYYFYTDKNGIKHYTDDLSEVPEDKRPGLNIYQSIQTKNKKESPKKENKTNTITLESIEAKKVELINEYNALVKKKEALSRQKKALGEKKYNELAAQFNIEVKQYQEKSDSYEKLVEQYNAQINPSNKK